jgi:hypothetical protein
MPGIRIGKLGLGIGSSGGWKAPSGLTVTLITGGTQLTWVNKTSDLIQVYYSTDGVTYTCIALYILAGTVTYNHYFDGGVTAYYKVCHYKDGYSGPFSNVVSIAVPDTDAINIFARIVAAGETISNPQKTNVETAIKALKTADLYIGQFDCLPLPSNGRASAKLNSINEYDTTMAWTKVCDAPTNESVIYTIKELSNGDLIAGTGTLSGHWLKSYNKGLTWVDKGRLFPVTEDASYDFCEGENGIVIAGTARNAHLLRSTDYGETFSDLGDLFGYDYVPLIIYMGGGVFIASTENSPSPETCGMLYSNDHGLTWSDKGQGGADMTVINMLCKISSTIAIAGGGTDTGGGVFVDATLIRTDDGGLTWSVISTGTIFATETRFFGSVFMGGRVIIGSDVYAKMAYSDDLGLTWKEIGSGYGLKSVESICAISENVALAAINVAGTDGEILRTVNKGLTWERLGVMAAGENSASIFKVSDGSILFSTVNAAGAKIYRSTTNFQARKSTNTYDLTEVANTGTLSFVAKSGFKSDGTKSYIKPNMIPYVVNPIARLFKQEISDATFGYLISGTFSAGVNWMGCQNNSGNKEVMLGNHSNGTGKAILFSGSATGVQPILMGYNAVTRDATTVTQLINADDYSLTSAFVVGNSVDKEIYLLCFNEAGTPNYWFGADVVLQIPFIGKSITKAKFLTFQSILNAYIAAL